MTLSSTRLIVHRAWFTSPVRIRLGAPCLMLACGIFLASGAGGGGNDAAIRSSVAQYLELQQSVLIPDTSESSAWPSIVPSETTIRPVLDAGGQLSLSSPIQQQMIRLATAAITSRQTASAHSAYDNWIARAIEDEASGFQVIGAGERLRTFQVDSLSARRASITATVDIWQVQAGGSSESHRIYNRGTDNMTLVRGPHGRWLVDRDNFDFVPGYGP